MKFIKLYESFEDINSICKKYNINNYTINKDGTVDVDGYVNIINKNLTTLPLKFGKVSGDFHCSVNKLTTLVGGPQSVGGNFSCMDNNLTTLEGCPQSIGGFFNCKSNELISLKGGPQSVGSNFNCGGNKLISLEFCPQSVGIFNCSNNQLISLKGGPQSVGGNFYFSKNKLSDLYGFPEFFDNNIYYDFNPVTEILNLFNTDRLGKVVDLLNEYDAIQQDGTLVILDRLEEVFYTLGMEVPEEISLENYEV